MELFTRIKTKNFISSVCLRVGQLILLHPLDVRHYLEGIPIALNDKVAVYDKTGQLSAMVFVNYAVHTVQKLSDFHHKVRERFVDVEDMLGTKFYVKFWCTKIVRYGLMSKFRLF